MLSPKQQQARSRGFCKKIFSSKKVTASESVARRWKIVGWEMTSLQTLDAAVALKTRRQFDIDSWETISSRVARTRVMMSWKQLNANRVRDLVVSSFTSIAYKGTRSKARKLLIQ